MVDSPLEPPRPTRRPRPTSRPTPQGDNNNSQPPDTSCNTIPQPTIAPTTEAPDRERETFLRICELTVLNTTQAILSLQSEVNSLRKTNQQLTTILERYPDGRKLTMSGRIPPNDGAVATVKFVLREKLSLNSDILSATKNSDGSITFELATLEEKLEVLDAAKEKLKNSRIIIS